MKLLLYCIFEAEADSVVLPREWDGRVELLYAHGMGVAFSRCESLVSPPAMGSLLEYERVVAWLHARCSVIPLRYGNVVDSDAAAVELLARRAKEFRELVARLAGKTEIGLRVLLAGLPPEPAACHHPAGGCSPGTAYLNSIRQRFQRDHGLNEVESGLVERIRNSVRHLDADLATELRQVPDHRLLAIYLLLPKENVDECRRCLTPFREDPSLKVLVTGPWPPYHSAALQGSLHA